MEKNTIIIIVIVGIIIFGLGIQLGSMMRKTTNCPKPSLCSTCLLDSKLTGSWTGFAKGEVKEISGRDLTLTSEGETLKVSILEAARISTLEEGKLKESKFADIKVGQKVEIQTLLVGKNFFGSVVTILP